MSNSISSRLIPRSSAASTTCKGLKFEAEDDFPVARRERREERGRAGKGRWREGRGEVGTEERREERKGEGRVRRRLWVASEKPSLLTR